MSEPMKILIGYDGSECADAALKDLERAGLPDVVDAILVTVAEVWMPEPVPAEPGLEGVIEPDEIPAPAIRQRAARAMAEAETLANRGTEQLHARFPHWKIRSRVVADSPAWGLLREADELRPDLVVVGSHGRNVIGRMILGSVSQKLLTESRSSVRIARGHSVVAGSPVRIVIGIDGTPDSMAAVEEVATRSWPAGTAVRVISALGAYTIALTPPLGAGVPVAVTEGFEVLQEELVRSVERAVERLRAAGLTADGITKEVAPIPAILDEAEEWGADAIFVGARGHRFMERFLLGSVSAAVAARAHCTVEVTRRPATP